MFCQSLLCQCPSSKCSSHWQIFCQPFLLLMAFSTVTAVVYAESSDPEELLVTGSQNRLYIDVADTVEITPDAAALLRKAPGATMNGNGPLSGIAQYRGMYGGRINIEVNGMTLSSGGPNWMDPPLHYAPAAQLESLEVYRGIAPVSVGQETIGGVINAKTWDGEFAGTESFESSGRIRIGGQLVNSATVTSVALVQSNRSHRLKVSGLTESADDAEFSQGNISPTEYRRDRYDIGYGFQRNSHHWQFDIGRNETGNGGTPALAMDIQYIDADMANMQYHYITDAWSIDAKLYYSDIIHGMSNYHLRQAPMMPTMWRRNIAEGDSVGFKVSTQWKDHSGHWTVGFDTHNEVHDSNIDNPNNAMFFVVNFNTAERDVMGAFAERNHRINEQWSTEFGLRVNQVKMSAGRVDATPAQMVLSPGRMLRDNFNNADRSQTDNNTDWLAKLYYQNNKTITYYIGIARKSRSASYQERYLWLPLQTTGGLADGRTYTGNIHLSPEVAAEVEWGFDVSSQALSLSPRIFYRDIDDYIQGTVSNNTHAVMFVSMMNNTSNTEPLEFNNVEATIYGIDLNWSYQINTNLSLGGLVNYVRGKRDDINDNLYRIAPANASLALTYQGNQWSVVTEMIAYAKQNKVSATNEEQKTAGYGLLNLRGYWQVANDIRLGFGAENIMDKHYEDHLAGYNRAVNSSIAKGDHLPGFGRNIFVRVDYNW